MIKSDPILWTMLNAIKEQQKEIEQLKDKSDSRGRQRAGTGKDHMRGSPKLVELESMFF